MTPDAQTQAEFRALVRRLSTEQARELLARIEQRERNVHDIAREIIWQEHRTLAPVIRPVDIDEQDRLLRIEATAEQVERLRVLLAQAEAYAAQVAAYQARPYYTPVFHEQSEPGYTPVQKGMWVVALGSLATWGTLEFFGPEIFAGIAAFFAGVANALMWACGIAAGVLGLYFIFKKDAPQPEPLDASSPTYIINQTVIINEQKKGSA